MEKVRPAEDIPIFKERKTSFNVIASSGHCGTKWLAAVLDSQPGVAFHHHWREELVGMPWEYCDMQSPDDAIFSQYWRWIRGELAHNDIGDANSWPPHKLLEVNKVQPISRVIYMARNGIQQLHSLVSTSPAFTRAVLGPAAVDKLATLANIGGYGPIDEWPRFKQCCLMVAANDFMPIYLRNGGLDVDAYTLEELTTDIEQLRELAPLLDDDEYRAWQRRDINRKVKGDREPLAIWDSWTDEQQQDYIEVVGEPVL